ncbi:MAG: hypothetical protein QM660_04780 [Dysgonomonas sp.]
MKKVISLIAFTVFALCAYSQQQQSFTELITILCLAILLVFTVLMILFREWMVSFIILFISVFSISGCLLVLGFGLGAQMQQPLAIAVIGGFVVGLPMLLIVLPSLMLLIYKREVG